MPHQARDPYFYVPSEGQRSELFWSFIWNVTHPVSDRTQQYLTSVKLMELAGPLGHSPPKSLCTVRKVWNGPEENVASLIH